MTDFSWDPDSYLALMAEEIADYEGLQTALLDAAAETRPERILDLGSGSGETARRVLSRFPEAELIGVDGNADMLGAARIALADYRVTLHQQRLQDPLPDGPFDLVTSALAVHHLDGAAKTDLFRRVREVVSPGARFVLADLVVPERPEDAYTEIDWVDDLPSSIDEQLGWLTDAGFSRDVRWRYKDLAVFVAMA